MQKSSRLRNGLGHFAPSPEVFTKAVTVSFQYIDKPWMCCLPIPTAVPKRLPFTACVFIVSVHGHSIGKRFTISFQGMKDSGSIAFGRNRFHAALKILLKEGLLRKSGGYAPGKNAQKYQIGSIILNKKKSLGAH